MPLSLDQLVNCWRFHWRRAQKPPFLPDPLPPPSSAPLQQQKQPAEDEEPDRDFVRGGHGASLSRPADLFLALDALQCLLRRFVWPCDDDLAIRRSHAATICRSGDDIKIVPLHEASLSAVLVAAASGSIAGVGVGSFGAIWRL